MAKRRRKKKKVQTRKVLIPIIVAMVIGYAAVAIYVQMATSIEVSSTLTTCWFAFWTVEVVALAGITANKNRINYDSSYKENIDRAESEAEHENQLDEEIN